MRCLYKSSSRRLYLPSSKKTWECRPRLLPCSSHVLCILQFPLDLGNVWSRRINMPSKACHPQRRWLDGPIASVKRRCSKYWPLAGQRVGAGNGRVFEQEPHEASLPVTDFTPRRFLQNISSVSQPNRESTTTSVTCVALFYSIKDAPTSSVFHSLIPGGEKASIPRPFALHMPPTASTNRLPAPKGPCRVARTTTG